MTRPSRILRGWKQIADFCGVSIGTARGTWFWSRPHASRIPIYRTPRARSKPGPSCKGLRVWAYRREITAWLEHEGQQ